MITLNRVNDIFEHLETTNFPDSVSIYRNLSEEEIDFLAKSPIYVRDLLMYIRQQNENL